MNNYELEKTIIAALLNDFDKAQTTHLNSEWFMIDDFKKIFEILNNFGSRLDGIMELFAKLQAESKGQGINYERLLDIQKDYLVGTSLDYLANELHLAFLRLQFSKLTAEHSKFPTKKTEAQMLEILNIMNKLSRKQNAALKKEILKALIDRDWTPTDLANEMGISRMYLNDLLNFRRGSIFRMKQIKKILGLE